ncbi:MAG: zinc ribbon domain-containing protein, partial [Thermoplasmata archaeon]|nr:zinc ribbon domain-containing protein [Thermoplasmata archaeon]
MAACPKCGTENPDDSKACSKAPAPPAEETATGEQAPKADEKGLAKDIDDLGKRIGDAIGKDALGWWDRKFGFFGPVLAGILAAFGLLVLFLVVGA